MADHVYVSSVHSFSCVWLFVTPWTAACQASLSKGNNQSLLKFMAIESVMPSSHLILGRTRLLLPSIFPNVRVFSNESVLFITWPKYWSFSFNISPSNEHSELISFRMDWLDPLAVQGTLKSLLQHHSAKASILQQSAFFIVQLSHPYKVKMKSLSHIWLFVTPWTIAYQAPLSMEFSRQECWSGLPFPSPGDLPNPGIEPRSPVLAERLLTIWATSAFPLELKEEQD